MPLSAQRVAVLDFYPDGLPFEDVSAISVILRDKLSFEGKYEVLEKRWVENGLLIRGVNPYGCYLIDCLTLVHQKLNLDYYVYGKISLQTRGLVLTAGLFKGSTSAYLWSQSFLLRKNSELNKVTDHIVKDILEQIDIAVR